jgi:hypothetical protein
MYNWLVVVAERKKRSAGATRQDNLVRGSPWQVATRAEIIPWRALVKKRQGRCNARQGVGGGCPLRDVLIPVERLLSSRSACSANVDSAQPKRASGREEMLGRASERKKTKTRSR